MHVTVRKCLVCLSDWVRTGHRMCYCLRGRSSSCLSWDCFLPSTHFPAAGRLGGISQTLSFVSSPCFLLLPPYSNQKDTEHPEDMNRMQCSEAVNVHTHVKLLKEREKKKPIWKISQQCLRPVIMTPLLKIIHWLYCELFHVGIFSLYWTILHHPA